MSEYAPLIADLFWAFVAVYMIFAFFGNPFISRDD
jgi:hypothetical protein